LDALDTRRRSDDIDDDRGQSGGGGAFNFGDIHLGIGGFLILLALAAGKRLS